ncbi:MAG: CHAT domain-containing protein [Saprospirales bacterium]|nr:MAG: CHAT domain-containing protein [Saprospirales bacterium]
MTCFPNFKILNRLLSWPRIVMILPFLLFQSNPAFSDNDNADSVLYDYYHTAWEKFYDSQFQQALREVNSGIEEVKSRDEVDYEWLIDFYSIKGVIYEELGHNHRVISIFENNILLSEKVEDEEFVNWVLSSSYGHIAVALSRLHLFESAVDYYQRAIYIDYKHFPDNHQFHRANYRNIGLVKSDLGLYEEALAYFEKAKYHTNQMEGARPTHLSSIKADFGRVYLMMGKGEKALEILQEAFALMDEYGAHIETFVNVHQLLMQAAMMRGDTAEAISILNDAIELIDGALHRMPMVPCRVYNFGGNLYLEMGNPEKAARIFSKCLEFMDFSPDLPPDRVLDIDEVLRAKTNLLRAEFAMIMEGDSGEKEDQLEEVLEMVDRNIRLLRHFIAGILIPHSKNRLVRERIGLFEVGINALYELYQINPDRGYVQNALFIADQSRSAVLLEDIVLRMTEDDAIASDFNRDMELKVSYDSLYLELNYWLDSTSTTSDSMVLDLREQMAAIRSEREVLFTEVFSAQSLYIRELVETGQPDEGFLNDMLDEGYSVLTHFPGTQNLFTLGLSNKGVIFIRDSLPDDLVFEANQLRNEIDVFPHTIGNSAEFNEHLNRLEEVNKKTYNRFFKGMEEIATEKLLIIPVDEISAVPFAAISLPAEVTSQGAYLVEEYEISYSYSLKALELQTQLNRERQGGFLVFAPEYHNEVVHVFGIDGELSLSPLEFNRRESEFLSRFYEAESFDGPTSTLDNFYAEAPAAAWVHLSGHAFINDGLPEHSFFAFSKPLESDGSQLLSINDISRLQLNAQVVFLNGCQTGYGPVQQGEGALSLQRAFASAGVSTLITTLWPVNDESAYHLTREFYEILPSVNSIPSALRKAALEFIDSGDPVYSHPYNWAGYVSYGNPSNPLAVSAGIGWFERLLVLGLVVLVGLWYLRKKR